MHRNQNNQHLANAYKISAINLGGFYYNILLHVGEDDTTISYELPEDFETKGSMPGHVYTWIDLGNDGEVDYWDELTDVTNMIITDKSLASRAKQ